jgi:cyclopropane fatty-acyl-phospholipid synthase-like methyltransferase
MPQTFDSYGSAYRHYGSDVLSAVRRESFDEDVGQNSWLTAAELRGLIDWLDISAQSNVLEIACGSGGPACYVARDTGCRLTGVDNNAEGVRNAEALAQQLGIAARTTFIEADANRPLPFADREFDTLLCIDALNHLRDRPAVLREWARVLRTGGRMAFTDPVVITGAVTSEELASRSSIGFFLFTPPGYTERIMGDAGLRVVHVSDASDAAATTSQRRRTARERHRDALIQIEGEKQFNDFQAFLQTVHELSASRRLSRFVYHAVKP